MGLFHDVELIIERHCLALGLPYTPPPRIIPTNPWTIETATPGQLRILGKLREGPDGVRILDD